MRLDVVARVAGRVRLADQLGLVRDDRERAVDGGLTHDVKGPAELCCVRDLKLTGAEYLVMGSLSAFETDVKGTGGGVSFRGISVGGKKEDAYLAVDLRVINTTTGEIEFTRTVEARASSGGLNVGLYRGGFGGNLSKYEKTPTGKAIRAVIMEISEYLACAMVDKGDCLAEYRAKEGARREKTKKAIKLD